MRAFTLLLVCLALIAAVNCYAFVGTGTVQVGSGTAWPATVRVDTTQQKVQITYSSFTVTELELYPVQSRYQTCPSSCKNYFLSNPIADFGYRSNGVTDSSDSSLRKYTAPSNDGYVTTIWVRIATNQLVKVKQEGNGYSRTYNFPNGVTESASQTFNAAPANCQAVQCGQALDLMLVIDSSGSISSDDYIIEMNYAQQVIDSFTIGTYGVHAGLITFATDALLRSPLTDNKASLTNIISSATQQQGETNIGAAINMASQQFASGARGGDVPKVIILLTDGKANRPVSNPISYMITAANDAKATGILIYAIGVGSLVQQSDLNDIASAPASSFTSLVSNFAALQSTINSILQQVCVGGETDGCNPSCYSDTQFCGCGTCLCAGSQSLCGTRGTWDAGTCSCACTTPWSQTSGGHTCSRCSVTSCSNGGTVISDPSSGVCGCDCPDNYAGSTCQTCTLACLGTATVDNCAQGTCKCALGTHYTPASGCTVCDPNYCVHGSNNAACTGCQCTGSWGGPRCSDCNWVCSHGSQNADCQSCSCNTPWTGGHCDNCPITCAHGTLDTTNCACICPAAPNDKYTGNLCDSCRSGWCKHGGTMNNNYPTCSCNCPPYWGGADCSVCQLTCSSGTLNSASCSCDCDPGFVGDRCDQCDANYCKNGATQAVAPACDTCTCTGNWGGSQCNNCLLGQTSHNPHCQSGTPKTDTCDRCICPKLSDGTAITQGTLCDVCSTSLCLNGGTLGAFPTCTCSCPSNFQGRRCNECVANLCSHNGTPHDSTCTSCDCDPAQNWSGTFCNTCNLNCGPHGTVDPTTCTCICNDYWRGRYCDICHNTDPELCDECSYNGQLNVACTACECDEYHIGEICDECKYTCGPNGQRSEDCRTCECYGAYIGDLCDVCDTSLNSIFCNGRGTIVNEADGCNICTCENYWGTDDCSECQLDCNGHGHPNDDCSACICDNSWSELDDCLTCELDCNGNGHVNTACTRCVCDGGYIGQLCNTCDASNYLPRCVHDDGSLTADCECDCLDQWNGRYCDECDVSALNCLNGDIIDYDINGEPQCRCRCYNFWTGDQCDYCGFLYENNPLYTCPDISEPVLTDCSCHCPEYYRDIEGCSECLITNDDCAHVKPGTVPDLRKGYCNCICDGNWSGRNCSICDPEQVTCLTGWRLNTDICECEEVCGDIYIVGDEECEVLLIDEDVDKVCCQDCYFDENRPCDDHLSCTRFDFCQVHGTEISCDGAYKIDYTVDGNRNPISTGPLNTNYWSQWGVTITSTFQLSIIDTSSLGYPTTNPYGGNLSPSIFNRAIAATNGETNAALCFNFIEPIEVQSVSVINNAREPGASNSFHIDFYCSNTINPISVDARNYGVGSVEFVRNPCTGYLVTKICYRNFPNAAIGPLFFCSENRLNLGRLGDYVWYDIDVDNVQDSNELPVPNVPCKLYDYTTGKFLAITYTNDQGLYIFEYLYNGQYSVEFNAPVGYTYSTPVRYPYPDMLHYGTLDNYAITDVVKEILIVDVGIYLFGAIGDYVYYDVTEDGLQNEAASYAISGVTLRLYETDNLVTPIRTQVTNSFGNYLFAPLPVYKTATTFHTYVVELVPPAGSIVTLRFSGSDRAVDSNMDRASPYRSDLVPLTLQKPIDLTIDAGVYYCCGSVGDRVWYDTKTIDGIQNANEDTGVANVRVTLYHNGAAVGSQFTNSTGYYLFTGLQLAGTYFVHFDAVPGYVLTQKSQGSDRELDSDANPNGDTDIFYLTRERPDRRDIDAGIYAGCTAPSECTSNDLCRTATCVGNQCVYTPSVTCAPLSDPCVEPVCQPATGQCLPVPKISAVRIPCQDNNPCTEDDVCVGGVCKGTELTGPGFTCSDSNTCTTDDHCEAGSCVGTPCAENPDPCITTICDATGCKDIPSPGTPCNDNNLCTTGDVCDATGHCGGSPKVCNNNEYCKLYTCDVGTGRCTSENTPGASCSDGNDCTENDVCNGSGVCNGTPKVCTGSDPCLNYFCRGGVCSTSVKLNAPCNDNDACTESDICRPDATCSGTPKNCDDGKVCTTDACESGTCTHRILPGATCTDNNQCTNDVCDVTGACVSTPIDCDDGKPCTRDQCIAGVCEHFPTGNQCTDSNPCTIYDACALDGTCKGVTKSCDDGNECTDDSCNPTTGACEHVNNRRPCDDHSECSFTSYCTDGSCVGYDLVECHTTNPCTTIACDRTTGSCIEESKTDGSICQTNDLCALNGVCQQGECHGTETVCNDGNPCTIDSCSYGECVYTHSSATDNIPCNDGNRCTEQDVCAYDAGFNLSRCRGTPKHCDDGNVCTHDFCNILTGLCDTEDADSTVTCTDNDKCTLNDYCVEGECVGSPKLCTPSAICKASECSATTGECVETITEDALCNDGDICTTNDTCDAQGNCEGTASCTQVHPNPCKEYLCSDTGDCIIVNVADQTACNDGNACTRADVCIRGQCTGTDPFPCTSDTCNRRECIDTNGTPSCRTTFTQSTCGTSSGCHDFVCSQGTCQTITNRDCNAGNTNVCTRRYCAADGTCAVENLSVACEDGDPCTTNACSNGECIVTSNTPNCQAQCTLNTDCPHADNCFHYECTANRCVLHADACAPSDNQCVRVECNAVTGQCEPHKLENTLCNDNNRCTSVDICVSTGPNALDVVCRGADIPCPTRSCKLGTCNPTTGECSYRATEGATCSDGVDCTENDVCDSEGNCHGTTISCDDGIICTTDSCVGGQCVHTNNDRVCSDGNACTSDDRCSLGSCQGTTQTNCGESTDPCKVNVCDPILGCQSVPVTDGEICGDNTDGCFEGDFVCLGGVCIPPERKTCPAPIDPQCPLVCVEGECQVAESTTCTDNNACTVQDRCRDNGQCIGVPLDCSHLNNGCVRGECFNGACVERPVTGATVCDDGDECTTNRCENAQCVATPITCQSDNPCERFICRSDVGCVAVNNPVSCTPTGIVNRCVDHICIDRVCTEVPPTRPCDDNNPCTLDQCFPETGECTHTNQVFPCSDNNPCTDDTCVDGHCVSTPKDCNDGNVCTDDACVGGLCTHTPNEHTCEFSHGCITGGVCSNKACIAKTFSACPTNNLQQCQTVSCDAATGDCIVHDITDGITTCTDNDGCTINDVCTPSGCRGTTKVCPTSSVECQESYCASPSGDCLLRANDDLQCHGADTSCTTSLCQQGVCVENPEGAIDCSDNDACTFNNKCGATGCTSEAYSCILSPCIYSPCDDHGLCNFDRAVDSWNPLTYISFQAIDNASGGLRFYLIALSSLTGELRGFVRLTDPIQSLTVQPYFGGLFAGIRNESVTLDGGFTFVTYLYRVPVNASAVNVFADGVAAGWPLIARVNINTPDFTFKPTFVASNLPHAYALFARSRQTGKMFNLDISTDPATATQIANGMGTQWQGVTYDNHGRYLYAVNEDNSFLIFKPQEVIPNDFSTGVYGICNEEAIIPTGKFIDMFTRYDESVTGAVDNTDGVNINLDIFTIRFTEDVNGNPICNTTTVHINKSTLNDPLHPESIIEIQAIAFDDTICLVAAGAPNSNGGNVTNTGGGSNPNGGSHQGGGSSPPPVGPPPDSVTHIQGGSTPGSHIPGTTDNNVLTGGTGSIATGVVAAVGTTAVAAFAIFAVVLGLNNTKKDPPANLTAALVQTDVASIASDNPLFQGLNEAGTNVLA